MSDEGEFRLTVKKFLAEHVLRDFERWVKANIITVGGPPVSEMIQSYLEDTYDD